MLTTNQKKWVDALRSGKYKQGRGYLCQIEEGEPHYCCLGVACELMCEAGLLEKENRGDHYRYGGRSLLSNNILEWLNLRTSGGNFSIPFKECISLTQLNDQVELSFAEIADFIESEPAGLFQ